jgi:BRCA1-associated protein 2
VSLLFSSRICFDPFSPFFCWIRIDDVDDQYSVIIRFDDQSSTDDFYKHFNRKRFSSLEV